MQNNTDVLRERARGPRKTAKWRLVELYVFKVYVGLLWLSSTCDIIVDRREGNRWVVCLAWNNSTPANCNSSCCGWFLFRLMDEAGNASTLNVEPEARIESPLDLDDDKELVRNHWDVRASNTGSRGRARRRAQVSQPRRMGWGTPLFGDWSNFKFDKQRQHASIFSIIILKTMRLARQGTARPSLVPVAATDALRRPRLNSSIIDYGRC